MNSAVPSKDWCMSKSFATDRTLKRFLSRMNSSMSCQVWIFSKTLSTFATLVWFRSTVNSAMLISKVSSLCKSFTTNRFFPEWIRLCDVNFEFPRKHFPLSLHLYGFSPLWILLCLVSTPASANRLPQTKQSNGFSPEWFRLCIVKAELLWKHFPHSLHLCLLLWIFICFVKLLQL